jgi:hypothetical protein
MVSKHNTLAEHQSPHGPTVLDIRGSLIVSSLETLRALDLFDRYLGCLPAEEHDNVLYILASSWVPIDLAMKHYAACEAMQLTDTELEGIGRHASQRIMGTFLGTLVRTASSLIAPGRVPLMQYPRLWDRLLRGGGCTVSAMGPDDARIESRGVPMFRYRYFRVGYTGLIKGAASMFRSSVHARVRNATDNSLTIELNFGGVSSIPRSSSVRPRGD